MLADVEVGENFFHTGRISFSKHQLCDFEKSVMKGTRLVQFGFHGMMHHGAKLSWEGIAYHRYYTVGACRDERERDGVVAADDQKVLLLVFDNGHDLLHVAAGFFDTNHIFAVECNAQCSIGEHVAACSAGHVVE